MLYVASRGMFASAHFYRAELTVPYLTFEVNPSNSRIACWLRRRREFKGQTARNYLARKPLGASNAVRSCTFSPSGPMMLDIKIGVCALIATRIL